MARRLIMLTLATALLAGCATEAPTARNVLSRQHNNALPAAVAVAPIVRTIPGYAGPAPTVSVTASITEAPAMAIASQEAAADLASADQSLEALELLSEKAAGFTVQGWFSDLKDAIKRVITRWKLKAAVKAELKHQNDRAFELHGAEIDSLRKNRTTPVTTVNTLPDGKEIVTTWTSTEKGTFAIESRRTIDLEGITQTLSISLKGTDDKDAAIEIMRIRTLMGEDGSYKVVTRKSHTGKDGRIESSEWTKVVHADGSERLDGWINHVGNFRTEITGTRDVDGKLHIEVSKIAPMHNPSPNPTPTPTPSPTPSPSPSASASPAA